MARTLIIGASVSGADTYTLFRKSGDRYIKIKSSNTLYFDLLSLGAEDGDYVVQASGEGYKTSAYSNIVSYVNPGISTPDTPTEPEDYYESFVLDGVTVKFTSATSTWSAWVAQHDSEPYTYQTIAGSAYKDQGIYGVSFAITLGTNYAYVTDLASMTKVLSSDNIIAGGEYATMAYTLGQSVPDSEVEEDPDTPESGGSSGEESGEESGGNSGSSGDTGGGDTGGEDSEDEDTTITDEEAAAASEALIGTWYLNEVLEWPSTGTSINFAGFSTLTALDSPLQLISITCTPTTVTAYAFDPSNAAQSNEVLYENGAWVDQAYRTLTITSTNTVNNQVILDFLAWIQVNGVKQN